MNVWILLSNQQQIKLLLLFRSLGTSLNKQAELYKNYVIIWTRQQMKPPVPTSVIKDVKQIGGLPTGSCKAHDKRLEMTAFYEIFTNAQVQCMAVRCILSRETTWQAQIR